VTVIGHVKDFLLKSQSIKNMSEPLHVITGIILLALGVLMIFNYRLCVRMILVAEKKIKDRLRNILNNKLPESKFCETFLIIQIGIFFTICGIAWLVYTLNGIIQ
jgi:hypothetical protein